MCQLFNMHKHELSNFILGFLVLFSIQAFAQDPSFAVQPPSSLAVSVGEPRTLQCKVINQVPGRNVEWYGIFPDGSSTIKYSIGSIINPNLGADLKSRLSIGTNNGHNDLIITSFQPSDEGQYRCTYSLSDISLDAMSTVYIPTVPVITVTGSSGPVKWSDVISLICSVTAKGEASVIWTLSDGTALPNVFVTEIPVPSVTNSSTFTTSKRELKWSSVSLPDSRIPHNYCDRHQLKCTATNGAGSTSQSVDLIVQYPPGPATASSSSITMAEGGSATLSCSASRQGNPNGTSWLWTKDGTTINGETVPISRVKGATFETISEQLVNLTKMVFSLGRQMAEQDQKISALSQQVKRQENQLLPLEQLQKTLQIQNSKINTVATAISGIQECSCKKNPLFMVSSPKGVYKASFNEAANLCKNANAELATLNQLKAGWELGMDYCMWGWIADGTTRFPSQYPRPNCARGRGIMGPGNTNGRGLANVWCFQKHDAHNYNKMVNHIIG